MNLVVETANTRGDSRSAFPFVSQLSDDVVSNILSFVAEAPFEQVRPRLLSEGSHAAFAGTLTHTLPFVCKAFYKLCRMNNKYWSDAIVRQMRAHSDVWRYAILNILEDYDKKCSVKSIEETSRRCNSDGTILPLSKICGSDVEAVEMACRIFCEKDETQSSDSNSGLNRGTYSELSFEMNLTCPSMSLYQYIVSNDLKFSGSIFFMPQLVQIGQQMPLHFFEPRYRFLIAEVMTGFPPEYIQGATIPMDSTPSDPSSGENLYPRRPPQFIYGTDAPLQNGSAACIVQVRQCVIRRDGTADVLLLPIAHGWFQRIAQRPSTGGLVSGTLIKMDPSSSQQRERRVHLWELQQRQHFHIGMLQHLRGNDQHLDHVQGMLNELVHGIESGEMDFDRRRAIIEDLTSTGIVIPDHLVSAAAAQANGDEDI